MQRVLAAFIFFTRLPFWRLGSPKPAFYARVVELWPLVGWLTGGVMALVWWMANYSLLPASVAAILAIVARLLITGSLHEDGLADFFDGFGAGGSRQRILEVMKDSHIGTYGVVALICYYLLLFSLVSSFPPLFGACVIFAADPLAKCCASMIINELPYARDAEHAKSKTVYARMSRGAIVLDVLLGLLPSLPVIYMVWKAAGISGWPSILFLVSVVGVPMLFAWMASFTLFQYMEKKIQGYTGDCCGATYIICEVVYMLMLSMMVNVLALTEDLV